VTNDGPQWSRDGPKEDGYYFRVNAGHRVQMHSVRKGLISWGWGGETG
jgi:hypothetical protein